MSFDLQIPLDLEVYGAMLLHAAVNPQVQKTLYKLYVPVKRVGSYRAEQDTINAYLAVDSPAITAYRVLVQEDRAQTIGILPSTSQEPDAPIDGDGSTIVHMLHRRWITALRLYCAVDGSLPHLANGKWKSIVTHYKIKVRD